MSIVLGTADPQPIRIISRKGAKDAKENEFEVRVITPYLCELGVLAGYNPELLSLSGGADRQKMASYPTYVQTFCLPYLDSDYMRVCEKIALALRQGWSLSRSVRRRNER